MAGVTTPLPARSQVHTTYALPNGSGVAVVTAVTDDGDPVGMVVGTFSSVSLTPR